MKLLNKNKTRTIKINDNYFILNKHYQTIKINNKQIY